MDLVKEDILLILFCIACTMNYYEDNFEDNELELCIDYQKLIKLDDYLRNEAKYV